MSEQVDIAVDLGVVPPPLPDVEFLEDFAANLPETPTQIVDGMLHQGCKMILGGTSTGIGPEFLTNAADRRQRRRLYQRRAKPWKPPNPFSFCSRAL